MHVVNIAKPLANNYSGPTLMFRISFSCFARIHNISNHEHKPGNTAVDHGRDSVGFI